MITNFKIYEVNFYEYTMDEVRHKLFGDRIENAASSVNDENLLYLIKLYVIHKEQWKNTVANEVLLTTFKELELSKIITIHYIITDISTWLPINDEEEFIEFINNPDLFKEKEKYNL